MTVQKSRILESVNCIKPKKPFKKVPGLAVAIYKDSELLKEFRIKKRIKYSEIPPVLSGNSSLEMGDFIFAKLKGSKKELIILNGRHNFYDGYSMRDVSHYIYVLKELGVKTVIIIDEVGHLNPRFNVGGVAMIYDHINLMGDNPLIGENDNTLGPRFPDMSNPYDKVFYEKAERLLIDRKFKFFPSVYIGVVGPETETEAECRFYREIGSDVVGYSIVSDNLAAVHSGLKCIAFGMISRELVADKLKEISEDQQLKNRMKAEKAFAPVFRSIISLLG